MGNGILRDRPTLFAEFSAGTSAVANIDSPILGARLGGQTPLAGRGILTGELALAFNAFTDIGARTSNYFLSFNPSLTVGRRTALAGFFDPRLSLGFNLGVYWGRRTTDLIPTPIDYPPSVALSLYAALNVFTLSVGRVQVNLNAQGSYGAAINGTPDPLGLGADPKPLNLWTLSGGLRVAYSLPPSATTTTPAPNCSGELQIATQALEAIRTDSGLRARVNARYQYLLTLMNDHLLTEGSDNVRAGPLALAYQSSRVRDAFSRNNTQAPQTRTDFFNALNPANISYTYLDPISHGVDLTGARYNTPAELTTLSTSVCREGNFNTYVSNLHTEKDNLERRVALLEAVIGALEAEKAAYRPVTVEAGDNSAIQIPIQIVTGANTSVAPFSVNQPNDESMSAFNDVFTQLNAHRNLLPRLQSRSDINGWATAVSRLLTAGGRLGSSPSATQITGNATLQTIFVEGGNGLTNYLKKVAELALFMQGRLNASRDRNTFNQNREYFTLLVVNHTAVNADSGTEHLERAQLTRQVLSLIDPLFRNINIAPVAHNDPRSSYIALEIQGLNPPACLLALPDARANHNNIVVRGTTGGSSPGGNRPVIVDSSAFRPAPQ